jgi:hypothetical protein
VVRVFGAQIPKGLEDSWKSKVGQDQVIGQAEIFPLHVARLTWSKFLSNKRVVYFIDNESARIASIRAYSPVEASLRIVMEGAAWDYHNGSTSWYARVPTTANIADDPSRMVISDYLRQLGAQTDRPIFPEGPQPSIFL